ncbi:MAG TPA: DUF3775 domain-containing protein [Acidocella sp.]|jgi:hypothetical protein|uniref:DUF3775 domain-containing protein n=1 Tax=Acidocella sp. TaxID=50710 RepID=UPI002CA41AD8|nr:DUF3775 domain-containing protein [Acidocella sp.]HVE22871.1 DUF3775 domain-containing protein [Acidocella sp.]
MPDSENLTIPLEKICFLISKARQFDGKDMLTDYGDSSNASDDDMRSVLESHGDDPVYAELTSMIRDLNEDEQIDLVALAWLGRGDGESMAWDELRAEAALAHNDRTDEYLLGMPLLGDYLEAALAAFDLSCDDIE